MGKTPKTTAFTGEGKCHSQSSVPSSAPGARGQHRAAAVPRGDGLCSQVSAAGGSEPWPGSKVQVVLPFLSVFVM